MKIPVFHPTLCVFFIFAATLRADVSLASLFQDHAVLQRDKPVPVWGWAAPGERVRVEFAGHEAQATADGDGHWSVNLPAMPQRTDSTDLIVQARNTITVQDVVVGDVWLCSGQSNMGMLMGRSQNAAVDLASARYPLIRHFGVPMVVSDTPKATVPGSWTVCSPATAGDFSAAAYFFAREVYLVTGVPIGLVNSSVGGSIIQSWLSSEALQRPEFAFIHERWTEIVKKSPPLMEAYRTGLVAWKEEADAATRKGEPFTKAMPRMPPGPGQHNTPSGLFNGMIAPFIPYALRGVIWYQGESNTSRASEYAVQFDAMLADWRAKLKQPDLPFYWVQLANRDGNGAELTSWALLREAQTRALRFPYTGQAITIDIGEAENNHPGNKQELGRRLALVALVKSYGQPFVCDGPVFVRAAREGPVMRVYFAPSTVGLMTRHNPMTGFEVAGSDQHFVPAGAHIDGETVVVSSPDVAQPIAVRYAWRNGPVASLFNLAGLPAGPFRSDDFPVKAGSR